MKKRVDLEKIKTGIKKESDTLKQEVKDKSVGYILAGFGVVAGLAWNDAIKALITYLFPLDSANSLLAQFGYAALMTILVVAISVYLTRLFNVEPKSKKKD
jgi:hypothetical protein